MSERFAPHAPRDSELALSCASGLLGNAAFLERRPDTFDSAGTSDGLEDQLPANHNVFEVPIRSGEFRAHWQIILLLEAPDGQGHVRRIEKRLRNASLTPQPLSRKRERGFVGAREGSVRSEGFLAPMA